MVLGGSYLGGTPLGGAGDNTTGGGGGTPGVAASASRSRVATAAAAVASPPTTPLNPPASLAAWQAMWDNVPLGSPSGWVGGDGCWSVTHPAGSSALFAFGDTPVLTGSGVVTPTGVTAIGQGSAVSTAYVIVLDSAAAAINIGDSVQVYLSDGVTLRDPGIFTVSAKPSSSGYTNLTFSYGMTSGSVAGDIVKVVTGGQTRSFPNSSAVLWTNAGLKLVSGTGTFVPNDGDGSYYWAGPMLVDTDGQLYVFASKQGPPPTPNPQQLLWSTLGQTLHRYTWSNPGASPVWQGKVADIGPGIQWGAAVVTLGGYHYIYGAYLPPDNYGNRLYLARIATGSLANAPTTWQFWTTASGGTWATGAGNLTSTTNLQPVLSETATDKYGVENSLSAHYYGGQVRLVSKAAGVLGSDITVWEGSSVTGPWTTRIVGSAPYGSPTSADQTYITLGHYNLPLLPDGKVLLSTSRNQTGHALGDYFTNTGWYRPKWFAAAPSAGAAVNSASGSATRRRGGTASLTGGVVVPPTPPGIPVVCELFVDGYWQNLSNLQTYYRRVRLDQGVSITRGQSGEQSATAVASSVSLRLADPDGFLSPRNPSGGWYGKIGRNTPLRVSITSDLPWLNIPGPTSTTFTGQNATTPDSAGLSITGDLDLRIDADLDSWSETTQLVSKWGSGTGSYALVLLNGVPYLATSTNGTAVLLHACPYGLPATRGRMALQVTLDVDNGAGGRTLTWATAPTLGGTYTALGPAVFYGGTTTIADTTAPVTLGGNGGYGVTAAGTIQARVYSAQIRQGINGTLRGSPDFTTATPGAASVTDGQGNVWTVNGGATLSAQDIRFHGEVATWSLVWDKMAKGRDLAVDVEAAGILRRLNQGDAAAKSALGRKLSSANGGWLGARIVAYWGCEDADGSDGLGSGLDGYPTMTTTGDDTSYASYSGIPGSAPLPTLGLKASWQGGIPPYPASAEVVLTWVMNLPTANLAEQNIISMNVGGTLNRVGVHTNKSGDLLVLITTPTGVGNITYGPYGFGIGGRKLRCELALIRSGANTSFIVTVSNVDGSGGAYVSDTVTGMTFSSATAVVVSNAAGLDNLSIGHVAVSNSRSAFYELGLPINATNGYRGERAGRRIQRLCAEEGIPFRLIGDLDDTVEVGVQQVTSPVANMQAAADADAGILSESRDSLALMFVPRSSMQSQDPALSLPYARLSSLLPVEDDRWTRNDITVSRTDGSSRRRTLNTGRLSILPPPLGTGRYDDSVELNLAYDRQLKFHTGWLLSQGTVDQARYPTINLQLAHPVLTSAQEYAMRRLDIGQKLQITGVPMWVQAEPITQLVTGFTETIDGPTYSITANCVPAAPYEVAEYSVSTTPGSRYDSAGSYLSVGDYGAGNTGLYVNTPDGPLWTTNGADFPFDLMIAGERVTVTGIGAPTGVTQLFTVTRSVNGVVKPQANNTPIQLAAPVVYGL